MERMKHAKVPLNLYLNRKLIEDVYGNQNEADEAVEEDLPEEIIDDY